VRVVFTREAEDGLEQIADYIARDNPQRAMSFVDELRASALGVVDFPTAYPFVPRYERLGIRRRVHGAYLIFFRVVGDLILILRIINGAQDYGRLLAPED
jgi:toxin ParE1/3/4